MDAAALSKYSKEVNQDGGTEIQSARSLRPVYFRVPSSAKYSNRELHMGRTCGSEESRGPASETCAPTSRCESRLVPPNSPHLLVYYSNHKQLRSIMTSEGGRAVARNPVTGGVPGCSGRFTHHHALPCSAPNSYCLFVPCFRFG
jgi:hypothetical protein